MNRLIWFALFSIGCVLFVAGLGECEKDEVSTQLVTKALPAGSFELRILASRKVDIPNDFDSLVSDFVEKGPGKTAHDAFAWYEVADDTIFLDVHELVIAVWRGRRFILASTAPEKVLDRRTVWEVESFALVKHDHPNSASVVVQLDQAAGEQLKALTVAYIEQPLGIFLLGKLASFAIIKDVIAERISLSGSLEDMERFNRKLQMIVE